MRQVITYLRFSSKPQERGDSKRRQEELFDRWFKSNPDATIADKFMDEGQSSCHGKHLKGDFGRMLQSIQDGKYPSGQTVLLVESENRLNRQSARKTENLVDLIMSKGVDVICLESGKVYNSTNIDDLDTSIQLKIAAHIAHQQSNGRRPHHQHRYFNCLCQVPCHAANPALSRYLPTRYFYHFTTLHIAMLEL